MMLSSRAGVFISLLLLLPAAPMARAWGGDVHQGLTGGFPAPVTTDWERWAAEICYGQLQAGSVHPDDVRDSTWLLRRLGRAATHQSQSVQRSARAFGYATEKLRAASSRQDLDLYCQGLFQLGESLHYLQDSGDPTKHLQGARAELSRAMAAELVLELQYGSNPLVSQRVEAYRQRARSETALAGAQDVAAYLRGWREDQAVRIDQIFERFIGQPIRSDCWLGSYRLDCELYLDLRNQMALVMGTLLAGQDRYHELAARNPPPQTAPRQETGGTTPRYRIAGCVCKCIDELFGQSPPGAEPCSYAYLSPGMFPVLGVQKACEQNGLSDSDCRRRCWMVIPQGPDYFREHPDECP